MKLFFSLIFLALFAGFTTYAQLQSPESFLGYTLGKKFTPHYRLVQYFEHAAKAMPGKMKLETYGQTYEGRPLLLAAITSEQNFNNLEKIRQNNLRLTGLLNDAPGDINTPAIVWLSYNVHGNEASSSEVSMKLLYDLLNNSNAQTQEWLKNTVVIIDPCLNPDGRDRYVNWYTQVAGVIPNASGVSQEHSEPWPGGRYNHYNYDLNRDWAWQTQVETQARIKKYNEWMPQIHADFHEQGVESPYYFAPAAEPFHEMITPFQRNFQHTIGKNHAKYFDAKGWLYFTKEYFDLLYPAYGDTYPTFNGSIGMTYEQAGHGRAGLAIALKSGDTLTLEQRIEHHHTTSLSTIEMSAAHTAEIMRAFKSYFDASRHNASGLYKTFIVKNDNPGKIESLKKLFDANQIVYGYTTSAKPVKGYNYFTGKDENINLSQTDLVLNVSQPKSVLLKVLFEPHVKLADSATYDITAWSLPYAYGVQAWAAKEIIPVQPLFKAIASNTAPINENAYAWLLPYQSWQDGKLLAGLINAGIKTRFAEKDFIYNGINYRKGTLVILRRGNETAIKKLGEITQRYGTKVTTVNSGFMDAGFDFGSDKLRLIQKPTVASLIGKNTSPTSAGEVWHLFEQELQYPLTLLNAENFNTGQLKDIDVLIIPDGNYRFLKDKDAFAALKNWVAQGGKIIALENAAIQYAGNESSIVLKGMDDKKESSDSNSYENLRRYEDRERESISGNIPGAIYKVSLDDSHPLAFGYPNYYFTLKTNSNLFHFTKSGWNVGVIKRERQVSGFVGNKLKNNLQDGTVIGVQESGEGTIIYLTDDPLFRSFWENGKLLFTNAVFLAGQ